MLSLNDAHCCSALAWLTETGTEVEKPAVVESAPMLALTVLKDYQFIQTGTLVLKLANMLHKLLCSVL